MNKLRHIASAWAAIVLFSLPAVSQQQGELPLLHETRVARSEKYAVDASLPGTVFEWKLESGGSIVRQWSNPLGGDTLLVQWGDAAGSYPLSVTEISFYNGFNCFGEPYIATVKVWDPLAPVALSDIQFVLPNQTAEGDVSTNDYSLSHPNEKLNFTLTSNAPEGFTFNESGRYTYAANQLPGQPLSVSYRVSYARWPHIFSEAQLVIYPIEPQRKIPVGVADYGLILAGKIWQGNLLANDFDRQGRTLKVEQQPVQQVQKGRLEIQADGRFSYQPNDGFTDGTDRFVYRLYAEGDQANGVEVPVTITVRPETFDVAKLPPVAQNGAWFSAGDRVLGTLAPGELNQQGQKLSYREVDTPVAGKLQLSSNGNFSYEPEADYTGIVSFTYQVCETSETNLCHMATAWFVVDQNALEIIPVPLPPQQAGYCQTVTFDATGYQGDGLTFVWSSTEPGLILKPSADGLRCEVSLDTQYSGTLPKTFTLTLETTDRYGNSHTNQTTVTFGAPPRAIIFDAGSMPGQKLFFLDGSSSSGEQPLKYEWSSENGQIISDPYQPIITLDRDGDYKLVVTDRYGCSHEAQFKFVNHIPVANSDFYTMAWNEEAVLNVLENDYDRGNDIDPASVAVVIPPQRGSATPNPDGTITYKAAVQGVGRDRFVYQVCDAIQNCSQAAVTIDLVQVELKINQGFSPNGDGINDTFVIGGLEKYPNSELSVYTRAGKMVYYSSSYRNNWNGRVMTNTMSAQGRLVPAGVYYYILKLGQTGRVIKGFVVVARE